LLEIFNYTNPKILVFSDDFKEGVTNLISHFPLTTLHLDGNGIDGSLPFESTLQSASDSAVTCPSLEAEDTAALIFTGGTTGLPKAAEVSHRMIAWNTLNTVIHDVTHNDVYLNVFPMFHTGGLFVYTLPQVIFGGTTILIRAFDPAQVLNLLEREKVTIFAAVPTMYQMLTTAPNWDSVNLSALRFCTSGGAPLPVPLVEKYTKEKRYPLQARLRHDRVRAWHFCTRTRRRHPQGWLHWPTKLFRRRTNRRGTESVPRSE
jgi:fatty-acyl-CoA synthase